MIELWTLQKQQHLMTGTTYETNLISGIYEILVNRTGAGIMQKKHGTFRGHFLHT
jgi:hypothetical protein